MKITTNFTVPLGRLIAPLLAVGWGLSLLLVFSLVWMIITGIQLQQEKPALQERLEKMQSKHADLPSQSTVSLSELSALKKKVTLINRLSGGSGQNLSSVLTTMEKLLPDSAYLVSLHRKRSLGEIRLVAEADSHEALTVFLQRLEQEPFFAEVLLTRQNERANQGSKRVQFEIRLKERVS